MPFFATEISGNVLSISSQRNQEIADIGVKYETNFLVER